VTSQNKKQKKKDGNGKKALAAGVTAIPSQLKITKQILRHWQPFQDLKLQSVGSRSQEQLSSRCQ
jgi:hypothetical protein